MRNNSVVVKKEDDSLAIYTRRKVKKMLKNSEISPEEAAFMRGYLKAGKKDGRKGKK